MKADPAAQQRLLKLQALDSRLDQLRHQRASLPQIAEIAELTAARTDVDDLRRDQQVVVDDLAAAQAKADADVEQVKTRRARDRDRMDRGLISNPKDLERMQAELVTLERRIGVLEDEELEVMEQLEQAQTELAGFVTHIAEIDARLVELTRTRDERFAELDEDLAAAGSDRAAAVEGIPADLLALYDRLRASKGGVAVSELRARQCGGCRLSLDASEIAEIRAAADDDVVRHEECQRILVRTAESGL